MSSINHFPTFHYSQPDEYHFSHDSVFLARRIFEELEQTDLSHFQALDICSGSGIVGLDFLFHRNQAKQSLPSRFDFLEIQESYRPHFTENQKRLNLSDIQISFINRNYNDLQTEEFKQKYNLIVSNPPYFYQWQGKLSSSEFKNRCRFFIDSDLKNLLLGISYSLKPDGVAFLLLRDLPEHKWNVISEAKNICAHEISLSVLGEVRGAHFIKLSH